MSLLEIENLHVAFPGQARPALDQASLSVESGEMMALVGESGSGKSVMALSIMQLLPPQADWYCHAMRLNGESLQNMSASRLRGLRGGDIGMIFQEPLSALNPLHTVEKQINESLFIHQGLSRSAARKHCLDLLDQVHLPEPKQFLDRYPHQLSGGQRQRVMIAMALANQPKLLIADEPTTALDVTVQAGIMNLLKQLQENMNLGILFISHDIGLVGHYADRTAVMQHGQILETNRTAQIMTNPQAAYTKRLLASEPAGSATPANKGKTLLTTRQLNVAFPAPSSHWFKKRWFHAVDNADIQLAKGETLGIVGESGSGKSSLAMAILRLQKSRGDICLAGKRLDGLSGRQLKPYRHHMQIVFQDPFGSLNPHMTVEQIVTEGLAVHEPELSNKDREKRVLQQLEEVGLGEEVRYRYPHEFSGGQRQRIAIARALILQPALVILDEPTSALDRSIQFHLLTLLQKLQRLHNLSYLFISHDLKVVRAISHRLAVMQNGKIVETGEAEQIFQSPEKDYTRELINAAFL